MSASWDAYLHSIVPEEAETTRGRHRSVFGNIPDEQIRFDGAPKWIRGVPSDHRGGGLSNRKYVMLLIGTPSFSYRPKPHVSGCSCRMNQTNNPKQ